MGSYISPFHHTHVSKLVFWKKRAKGNWKKEKQRPNFTDKSRLERFIYFYFFFFGGLLVHQRFLFLNFFFSGSKLLSGYVFVSLSIRIDRCVLECNEAVCFSAVLLTPEMASIICPAFTYFFPLKYLQTLFLQLIAKRDFEDRFNAFHCITNMRGIVIFGLRTSRPCEISVRNNEESKVFVCKYHDGHQTRPRYEVKGTGGRRARRQVEKQTPIIPCCATTALLLLLLLLTRPVYYFECYHWPRGAAVSTWELSDFFPPPMRISLEYFFF